MASSAPVDVMTPATAAAAEEGSYVQLNAKPATEDRSSRLLAGAGFTAITLLLTAIVSLPAYLLLRSAPSIANPAAPFDGHSLRAALSNSSQYGDYPMLYEDPNNQWTPADGFLFNMTSVDIDLQKVPLAYYTGNITLVTNVASF